MLTIETITTAGERAERAYRELDLAIARAAEGVEAANAARIELEDEHARILREVPATELGPNEAARKAAVAELTIIQRQAVAAAEEEEVRAKAHLEQAKVRVSAAKRALEVLDLAARVYPLTIPAAPVTAKVPKPSIPVVSLDRPIGSVVLITWMDGNQEVGSIAELDAENAMYWVTYGDGDKARIPPSYLSDVPQGWTPAAPTPAAPLAEDDAKITTGQVAQLLDLSDRAFPTLAGFTKWLWNTHRLTKPELDLIKGVQFNAIIGQLADVAATREAKAATKSGKAKARPPVEEAPPPEPAQAADAFEQDHNASAEWASAETGVDGPAYTACDDTDDFA